MTDRYKVILSPKSLRSLVKIHRDIAVDSPRAAADMVARILDAIDLLALFPLRQTVERNHPRGQPPFRSLPVRSYVVFFRVNEDQHVVNVVDIRHGARRRPEYLD